MARNLLRTAMKRTVTANEQRRKIQKEKYENKT